MGLPAAEYERIADSLTICVAAMLVAANPRLTAALPPGHGSIACYALLAPFLSGLRGLFPRTIATTQQLGRAMIRFAQDGYPTRLGAS